MRKGNKFNNVALMLAVLLLVGCGTQTKGKETVLETKQETVLETTLESKKETLEETSKESKETEASEETTKETTAEKAVSKEETSEEIKASGESKGSNKKQEIDGTVRPKKSKTVDHKDSKKAKEESNSTQSSSEKKPEPKKEEPAKKKSNEEIAKEVLNGSWGSGQDRKNRLESAGYNYSEVQAIVNKIAPAPVVQKRKSASSGSAKTQSNTNSVVASMPNNSILINGVVLRVSNNATQDGIDAGGRRIVNWGVEYMGNKKVGGPSAYFALHHKPYGYLFQNASSFIFKDINGNVKTYNIESRTGVRNWQPKMSDDQFAYTRGDMGDRIAVQTCIDRSGSSRYRIHVFS